MSFEDQDIRDWSAAGDAELDDIVSLRRAIHAEPEVGLHCPRTTDKIKAALAGLPLELHESGSTTGLIAILRGQAGDNGRTVLLRGDMDALTMQEETGLPFASTIPGRMHACGHDSHTAMLVGAVRALSARRDRLPGTVVFMFQPGEEGHHGARFMIDDGLLDIAAPDAAFALHITPNAPAGLVVTRAGSIMASADTLHAVIRGAGGHAAMPHDCIDPVPVACEIVTALQTFVARRIAVTDPAVLSITKIEAGSAHNIIPGEVTLLGTLRTLSEATRDTMQAAFRRIVENIAAAHESVAGDLGADFATMPQPMMGAEDFSYVLRRYPGAFAFLGVAPAGSDPATNPPLHNTRMTIEESVMARGVAIHCAVAMRYLERGFD